MTEDWGTVEPVFYREAYDLRPWYHDFARLGLQTVFSKPSGLGQQAVDILRRFARATRQQYRGKTVEKGEKISLRSLFSQGPSSHLVNQYEKERVIYSLLTQATDYLQQSPSCLDLFCSDGYYSCLLARVCPSATITGVDLDPLEIERARTASQLLKADNCRFVVADVQEYVRQAEAFDLVLCTGGLYHLKEPRQFLQTLSTACKGLLIIQSVVTLETEDPGYFISPAPGWKHGSRFTHAGLRLWLEGNGWDIIEERRHELPGNQRRCDRGSSCFLCRVSDG
jgi:tRNA (mo5U34)-methyltransferase